MRSNPKLAAQAVKARAAVHSAGPARCRGRVATEEDAEDFAYDPPLDVAEDGIERAERFYEKSLKGPDW